jgi:hypothetical protein
MAHPINSDSIFAAMMKRSGHWIRTALVALAWLGLSATAAHAHGGIAGPDELGPPVIISVIIGIVCYWTVILWPSRNQRDVPRLRPKRR